MPELLYAERLSIPLRWWVQGTMLLASLWLALVVAVPGPVAWGVTTVAAVAIWGLLTGYGGARIELVRGSGGPVLRAGRARIAVEHLGPAVALDAGETRRAAGVEADARAFLLLRPYLAHSVRVELRDPRDPTPYWLLSSRDPGRLVDALRGARQGDAAGGTT